MRFSIALLTALTLAGTTSAKAVEDRPDSANAIMPGCRASLSNQYNDQLEAMMAGVCVGTVNGLIFEASVLEQMSARVPHAEVCPRRGNNRSGTTSSHRLHRCTSRAYARAFSTSRSLGAN